ncbi:MAG: cadherin-like domain-containing protein, partial [Holophagales bacterium]|nr:cadherin-like domain-containing protein [Holophagales bacterium]
MNQNATRARGNRKSFLVATLATLLTVHAPILHADAPPLPLRVYGELPGIDAGAAISAHVGGVEYASTTSFVDTGNTVFIVDVPGDDPSTPELEGATDGAVVTFRIDGIDAEETAVWAAGVVLAADLHRVPTQGGPTALDQSLTGLEDVPLPLTLQATDPGGEPLTFLVISAPEHGTLLGTPPSLTYVPGDDFFGTDSLTYTASDAGAASNPATVTFTVDPVA